MEIPPFSDPELYLLKEWPGAALLERSMKAVRNKYAQILDVALEKLKQRHKELDCRGIHMTDEWELNIGIGKKSWSSMYPNWPSGFWLGCITLDNLAAEDGDTPFACVHFNPPKSASLDLDGTVRRLHKAAEIILTREQMDRVEEEVLKNEADIWYSLPEPRRELLEMLMNNRTGAFIDRIVAHLETLTKFIPVMDEISHDITRKGK